MSSVSKFITNKGPYIAVGMGVVGMGYFGYYKFWRSSREIAMAYKQEDEADGFTVKRIEEAYKTLQEAKDCKSLLKKHFTADVKDKLKYKKTKLGASLFDVIRSGVKNLDSGVGVYAADSESYKVFSPLFDPVINEYHGGFGPKQKHPPSNFGEDRLGELKDLDPDGKYILSTRIRCGRSLLGYPFNPLLMRDDYLIMQQKVRMALENLEDDPEIGGTYYPLEGMTKEIQKQLIADHFLFKEGDRFLEAANSNHFWPTGRGIFHNAKKTFLVWVNEEDHLRIISMQKGGDVGTVLKRLIRGVKGIEKQVPFARDDRLGYLTFCPSNLGTTIRASVHIRLPKISAKPEFKKICEDLKLQVRGIHGEHSESEGGVYDVSNKARLGLTEFEAVKQMYDGVKKLIELEKASKTALQLPDELLKHSFLLVEAVERRVESTGIWEEHRGRLYVLADTSYRSCCLDEIAAEHVACDSIVHFGDACLSARSSSIPALYIFCRHPFELEKFVEQFRIEFSEFGTEKQWDDCLLLCEAAYTHIQSSLGSAISRVLPPSVRLLNFEVSALNSPSSSILGRQVPDGFVIDQCSEKKQHCFLLFVGSTDSPLLPIAHMTFRHIEKTVVYTPETGQFNASDTLTNRMLLRRLYLIERLRDARTVGLVVGAVALRGCREAVARVRKLCEMAGKKLYVMYIGKLNEAKLSNFGIDVEVFVLLSCPFGIILDGTKFCRPILSVFEAEVALDPTQSNWLADMRWTSDIERISMVDISCCNKRKKKSTDDDVGLMSLTSGNIRRCNGPTSADEETNDGIGPTKDGTSNTKQLMEYTAGDHFAMRSWRGLEDNSGSNFCISADGVTERQCPCEVKQGMDGIATRYVNEPFNSDVQNEI
ncbi:hypothetical protein niasHT_005665 [Heterodera trifolii]|uniref:2-(3-amino-3-carboxypropyl)histidine synthase subunit 2 n=1 Tax=Heterodera trifolii TaxID=157864 RepID=A0ABD2M7Z0_9BILA